MIDTDKYEGHTPAPWFYYDDGGLSDSIRLYHTPLMDSDGDDTEEYLAQIHYDENCIADSRLIADAPLLLAEVKRLRKALLLIAGTANGRPFVSGHIGLPFVHEVFKELIQ